MGSLISTASPFHITTKYPKMLPEEDSNLYTQNQNLMCCHYTIRHHAIKFYQDGTQNKKSLNKPYANPHGNKLLFLRFWHSLVGFSQCIFVMEVAVIFEKIDNFAFFFLFSVFFTHDKFLLSPS